MFVIFYLRKRRNMSPVTVSGQLLVFLSDLAVLLFSTALMYMHTRLYYCANKMMMMMFILQVTTATTTPYQTCTQSSLLTARHSRKPTRPSRSSQSTYIHCCVTCLILSHGQTMEALKLSSTFWLALTTSISPWLHVSFVMHGLLK